ncbi:fimbria/pilus periplasmic chaperone [Aeromonas jandaei]|uniref:fimbria/pilus periplasmic chaperone n=1 Tax=Aeromonas jandaei TaxID=650 RepID=UPI00191F6D4A|nr:fimbria/pilus periplasmic chaperone [Aeromonas jandaei]MBL0669023.1 fimbria/pilus periplasmic chaperone [Aeromonas jandaei]
MRLVLWCVLTCALTSSAMAIDIGPMTAVMGPKDELLSRTVTNNSATPKVYDVHLDKISNPTASGLRISIIPGELLFTPKRFMLHGRQTQNVKFFYKGADDKQERYYRVTFTESPTARTDEERQAQRGGSVEMKVVLQSILVVRPRQVQFEYQLDAAKGSITNTGNTYFEFMVKQGCDQSDGEADSKYLLPGETYHNPKITQPGNHKLIVYQSQFIPVGKDCWGEK